MPGLAITRFTTARKPEIGVIFFGAHFAKMKTRMFK
jgi:hypothetical protein